MAQYEIKNLCLKSENDYMVLLDGKELYRARLNDYYSILGWKFAAKSIISVMDDAHHNFAKIHILKKTLKAIIL